ncbi:hypothetical protein [Amycolatopsis orientalis]|uniref:hypothetical protein n=1 Tax=Amycolatopsis orientalis TaxID=31958 RepID=UPI0003A82180|nr:hypothetical protein [Amycolatopsis orientalis]
MRGDADVARFIAATPAGYGEHRCFVLDVTSIGFSAAATPAVLGFTTLGRAVLVATAEAPA